ncbi:MAG: TetR/AcrR family transcriptional regulator C-terminal domain-containing protein [Eubacterium sp.]|nr:TetR/AcrR family transcriptional regulator C-terminal domain-containing protein [Eubacterium sp.]
MGRNDTKEMLFEAYKELGKKKTLDKITVREICVKCGVTTQTFYNHFSDKYDMILWNHRKRVDELAEKYIDGSETFEEVLSRYVFGFIKYADFVINAYRSTVGQDSYMTKSTGYLADKIKEIIRKLAETESLPEEIDFFIEMYSISLSAMIAKWIVTGRTMPPQKLVDLLIEAAPPQLKEYVTDNT